MKETIPKLSQELFEIKLRIEEELSQGNKTRNNKPPPQHIITSLFKKINL